MVFLKKSSRTWLESLPEALECKSKALWSSSECYVQHMSSISCVICLPSGEGRECWGKRAFKGHYALDVTGTRLSREERLVCHPPLMRMAGCSRRILHEIRICIQGSAVNAFIWPILDGTARMIAAEFSKTSAILDRNKPEPVPSGVGLPC